MTARSAAVRLLDQILGEGRLMSECLGAGLLEPLPPEDRARAQRLALDTLRGLERADKMLSRHLRKSPPLHVRNALRLGAVELATGGAAHGVVSELVGLVGQHKRHAALKGLVNAVLRKLAEEAPDLWPRLRVPRLPRWLRDPLVAAWGREAVAGMEAAHFAGAPVDLTARSGQAVMPEGAKMPTGSTRLSEPGQISALPGYDSGDWWVQDAAAALPARVLAVQRGEHVLDMCAAPGGKTLQMAAAGALVTALDISDSRLERVRENLDRTGLEAKVVAGDALEHTGHYDAILLDAPCSATGTIRRHPDLPRAKDGSEFLGLFNLQQQMIDRAWSLLKPGGRMVFCTCSLLPDEGEVQIEDAMARHSDMGVDQEAVKLDGVSDTWLSDEGGLRLRPDYWADKGGMDGFYIAALRKRVASSE